ncbi:hypothetical protein PVAP13_8KG363618 [Panicum virgatum]|uniref:Uncharacterized protein n=1 Tax=Panicum virgatum TaxID=38727 RepID=A0A8T0PTL5_PANVG|nr:hypothetical protein PVAP13_8KG363618 [Panicum virgatum]
MHLFCEQAATPFSPVHSRRLLFLPPERRLQPAPPTAAASTAPASPLHAALLVACAPHGRCSAAALAKPDAPPAPAQQPVAAHARALRGRRIEEAWLLASSPGGSTDSSSLSRGRSSRYLCSGRTAAGSSSSSTPCRGSCPTLSSAPRTGAETQKGPSKMLART